MIKYKFNQIINKEGDKIENKNIILIVIAVLVIALVCVGAYILTQNDNQNLNTTANTTQNLTNTSKVNTTNSTPVIVNDTVKLNTSDNNTTHRVYDPQNDSYVTVIGEAYDSEVDRWYTYDSDGVRYYNTRIKN